MTTSGVESASFQNFSMVDDSMEISSEHGGLTANDDIDIDIDFTAGLNDEDYILEDAQSDVEFRESFGTALHPTNDDVMVDDYNSSLPMEEQHGDSDEQFQDVPDETLDAPEMEISNELPTSDHADRRSSDYGTQVPVSDAHVQLDGNAVEITSLDANEVIETRSPQHVETLLPVVSPSPNFHSGLPDETNTHPDSPENSTIKDGANSSVDKDTLAGEENNPLAIGDDCAEHQADPVAADDNATTGETEVTEDIPTEEQAHTDDMYATYGGIMVSYQDTQYALFSSSEDDDSDSFFLKDRSIAQQPIASFLKALRDILQEELADDDELCIAIDVLRLEFGERSAEIDKVTFDELIYLHQQLLRNDGIDSPEPLNFTLGTRPEFAKRFVGLLASASEGKGLSEIIPRDEESESYDDLNASVHPEEEYDVKHSHSQDGSQCDDTAKNEENAGPLERVEDDEEGESIHDVSVPEELDDPQVHVQSIEHTDAEEKEKEGPTSENFANLTSPTSVGDTVVDSQEVQLEQKSEAVPTSIVEQQEEDDLIDYGDEEIDSTKRVAPPKVHHGNYLDFVTPCLKPGVCFCTACNEILLATYEAINEDLRRRSLSRAAENKTATDHVNETPTATNGVAEAQEPAEAEEPTEAQEPANETNNTDEIDYDFDEEIKELDNDGPQESHEDNQDNAEIHAIQNDQGEVDDYYTGFDDQQEDKEDDQIYNFEEDFDDGQDIEDEDKNFESLSENLKVVTSTVTEIAGLESNTTSPHGEISAESVTVSADTADIDEIDYEDDLLAANVEGAPDASNPQQSHVSGEADFDEINYDDDDDEVAVTPKSAMPESLHRTASGTPGKRQRSESISEVALGEGSQEAKRIRS